MRSIRCSLRNLVDLLALSAMALLFALAWGNPFISDGTAFAQGRAQAQQRPDQGQARSGTFTGTVVKDGSDYMLRDSSGEIFKLDDAERAKPFEGKTVKVTGQLDEQAKMIHVESIQGTEG